jgi:hypothetical protein
MDTPFRSPVPPHAEALNLFDHVKSERWASKFAPHAQCLRMTLVCPACETNTGAVPFSEQVTCRCGLHMWPGFHQLFIWRDEPLASVAAPAMAEPVS